jgi:hypothetical protein
MTDIIWSYDTVWQKVLRGDYTIKDHPYLLIVIIEGVFTNMITNEPVSADEVKKARKSYLTESRALREIFKRDLQIELGLAEHPRGANLIALAWEYGHSEGYNEVIQYAYDLAPLLR